MRAAVAMLVALLAGPAAAQKLEMKVRVERGDTLELLAAEYYGARQHAVFIMKANKMTHPRRLRPGERIKIPIQRELTTSAGDTLAGLAAEHLGDPRRAEFLAAFNNLSPSATIAAGQRLVVPFHVEHQAASRETIESIAAAYLGDSKKAELLQRYNFTDQTVLERGEVLVVPINNVRVRAEKLPPMDASSAEREERQREMEAKAIAALPAARLAWESGDHAAVKRNLVDVDLDYLRADTAAAVGVLLGSAYIAFDDDDSALAAFQKVIARKPDHALTRRDHSPKVRALWSKAGGAVE